MLTPGVLVSDTAIVEEPVGVMAELAWDPTLPAGVVVEPGASPLPATSTPAPSSISIKPGKTQMRTISRKNWMNNAPPLPVFR